MDQCPLMPLAPWCRGVFYFSYSTVEPQAELVGFCVHGEVFVFISCAKQKLVFSADRAAAVRRLPVSQPRLPASHQVVWDSGEVVVILKSSSIFEV